MVNIESRKNKSKIKLSKEDRAFDIVIKIVSFCILAVVIYPLLFILSASLSEPNFVNLGKVVLLPKGLTIDGYKRIFHYTTIWVGYRNTIIYTTLGTITNVVLTIMAAYPLSRKDFYGKKVFTLMITFTMFFNGGLIPTYLLIKDLHMLNTVWVMFIPNAIAVWNVIITRTFFMTTIPDSLKEAAQIDGSTNIHFLIKVVIPLSKAIVAVIALFYAVAHWNEFFTALIYLNDENRFPLQLILRSILIQLQIDENMVNIDEDILDQQRIADIVRYGLIIVSSLPMLIVYPFLQRYFIKGVMIGSLKG